MSEASKTPVWGMAKEDLEIQVTDLRAKLIEALDRAQRAEEESKRWADLHAGWVVQMVRAGIPSFGSLDQAIAEQSSKIAELEHEIDEVDGTCNRLAEEKNKMEQDIQAYRGALGYTVPAKYDGKRSDGSTPVCGLCDAKAKTIVGLECELGRRCWHCKLPIYPGEARKSFNPAPHAASGGTWLYAHDQCPALASSGQGATEPSS